MLHCLAEKMSHFHATVFHLLPTSNLPLPPPAKAVAAAAMPTNQPHFNTRLYWLVLDKKIRFAQLNHLSLSQTYFEGILTRFCAVLRRSFACFKQERLVVRRALLTSITLKYFKVLTELD